MTFLKNAFCLSSCRVLADLVSFLLFMAIARQFGPAGNGEYSYAFAIATLVALAATSGLGEFGVRQFVGISSDPERQQCWRNLLLAQCIQLVFGLLALGVALAIAGGRYASPIVILELAIFVVAWQMSRTFYIPANAAQKMAGPAFTELCCRLAAILSALVAILLGVDSLPWALVGFPIAAVALFVLSLRNAVSHGMHLRLGRKWRESFPPLRGAAPFAGNELMNQFYARSDLLLIAYLLGDVSVGLYATDVKFVDVGVTALVLVGMAAYPVLTRNALHAPARFALVSKDFVRSVLFLSGWLAVGLFYLVPLLIPHLFGEKFAPSADLLPWFALLAIAKGLEVALYRLLYAVQRQNIYLASLLAGTATIIGFNFLLIPLFGLEGAVGAGLCSIALVDVICIWGLRREMPLGSFGSAVGRLGLALAATGLMTNLLEWPAWYEAGLACVLFPLFCLATGLLPNLHRSPLFARATSHELTESAVGSARR